MIEHEVLSDEEPCERDRIRLGSACLTLTPAGGRDRRWGMIPVVNSFGIVFHAATLCGLRFEEQLSRCCEPSAGPSHLEHLDPRASHSPSVTPTPLENDPLEPRWQVCRPL